MRRTLFVALASLTTLAAGAAMAQQGGPPRGMPAPEDVFKRWDANSDGAVDKAEWTGAGRPEDRFAMIDAIRSPSCSAAGPMPATFARPSISPVRVSPSSGCAKRSSVQQPSSPSTPSTVSSDGVMT